MARPARSKKITRKAAAKRPRRKLIPEEGEGSGKPVHAPCPIVAMGASAGGLEAYERFFDRMEGDSGLAFILIPHLDARHKSAMVEILQRHTTMSVIEIKDGTPVEPNRVHIIPPNATVTMIDGKLRVVTPRSPVQTIDTFFKSLAATHGEDSIGIILSGSGSDGTSGIKAIKEAGGLTMAQAFSSSRYDSMPHSAVATGLVDVVLPVEDMPAKLVEYATHVRRLRDRTRGNGFREEVRPHLVKIYTLLRTKTGHDFSRYKDSTFVRRVQRRMQVVQLSSVTDYIALLRKDPREIELLFRDLLIGVTHFFRDPQAYEVLQRDIIPKLLSGKGADDQLRVWVAGCATGEEAYSIAILLRERLATADVAPKVQIFATDIDDEALETARAGVYSDAISRDISKERLERFFVRDGTNYRVVKDIREMCIFSVHNLIKDAPFSKLDLVSCRNLLIYLDASLQNRVIPLFHFALRHGGYLFLGPSENISQHSRLFTRIDAKHRIFKARPVTIERPPLEFALSPGFNHRAISPADRPPVPPSVEETVSRRAQRIMEAYAPAYVVIDDHQDVVHFAGRTGKYLQPSPGTANLNLFNILDASLRPDVRTVLQKVMSSGQRALAENVSLTINGHVQSVNISAEPVPGPDGGPHYYVLAFQDVGAPRPRGRAAPKTKSDDQKGEAIAQLEAELLATKERLQATIEELETSNEEMKASNEEFQSVNEELQSSNEELETSKEELQSVNEELETVNTELNSKVESLERANNDRKNLLESTQIATIFLDNNLRIKSFTPAITEIFHLIEGDYGRPITDIVMRLAYDKLEEDVRKVLRTLSRAEQEVALADGSASYMMRILPYRTFDNMIDGVVVTFVDITERKRNEEALGRLASIVESSYDAIIGITPDGAISTWNAGAVRMYGYGVDEAVGQPFSLIMPRDRQADMKTLLENSRRQRNGVPSEVDRMTKDGRRIPVASTISPVRGAGGKVLAASAIERDIGQQKHAEQKMQMLLAELNHRVKNMLTTVLSLASRTMRHSDDMQTFRTSFEGRTRALAKAYDILAASGWSGADLETVIVTSLAPFRERGERLNVRGDHVLLKPNPALIIGMITHELATNAAKHGALSTEKGSVDVTWALDKRNNGLTIHWTERGGPKVAPPAKNKKSGFGLTLIERGLTHELGGRADFDFASTGLRCTIELPLSEAASSEGSK